MSMGYGSAFAEVIEDKNVKKFCPKEFKNFMDALETTDSTEVTIANLEYDSEEVEPNVTIYYKQLQDKFRKKTGLELYVGYHDSHDEGDRYDEVDGVYFHVGGMYELTKAGKKMSKYVQRKFFVCFG